MIFLTDEQLREAERYADNETARCLVDEVKHLRQQLAAAQAELSEVERERDEARRNALHSYGDPDGRGVARSAAILVSGSEARAIRMLRDECGWSIVRACDVVRFINALGHSALAARGETP